MAISVNDLPEKMQKQAIAKYQAEKSRSKYGNRKTTLNGIKFDSNKEADRYMTLLMMQKHGEIRNLKLQQEFHLIEKYVDADGNKSEPLIYRADFVYERKTAPDADGVVHWVQVVEDVKGKKTDVYNVKKKLMFDKFGITIKET